MWIEELKNGKYKYVERYEDPLTGKDRKVSITHTKKNNRVEKQMTAMLQEKIEKKTQESSADISFKELTDKWLNVYEKQVKLSSYNANKNTVHNINKELGERQLSKLKPQMVNQFILSQLENGNSYRYTSKMLSLITRALKFGLQYGYFNDTTFVDRLTLPKINMPQKDNFKFLERNELKELLSQLRKKGYNQEAALCELQVLTGMRFGEVVAIDYTKHVDFDKRLIHVNRTYSRATNSFSLPKGGEERTIHVKNKVIDIIKKQIKFKQLMMLQYNIDRDNALLFVNQVGKPYAINKMNVKLKLIELESKKHLTTHIFRHTFVSYMVEAGIDTKLIAEHVGHSDTKMVEEVYSHFTELMDERLKEAIKTVKII